LGGFIGVVVSVVWAVFEACAGVGFPGVAVMGECSGGGLCVQVASVGFQAKGELALLVFEVLVL
jgi:hypothetical protein